MDGNSSLCGLEFLAFAALWNRHHGGEMPDFSLDAREISGVGTKPLYREGPGWQRDLVSAEHGGLLEDSLLLCKAMGRS